MSVCRAIGAFLSVQIDRIRRLCRKTLYPDMYPNSVLFTVYDTDTRYVVRFHEVPKNLDYLPSKVVSGAIHELTEDQTSFASLTENEQVMLPPRPFRNIIFHLRDGQRNMQADITDIIDRLARGQPKQYESTEITLLQVAIYVLYVYNIISYQIIQFEVILRDGKKRTFLHTRTPTPWTELWSSVVDKQNKAQ